MFQIFGKKRFLVDYLENFVDIHNHILPGIDDGAKSVKDSLKLLKAFTDLGITNFVATPHIMHNYYPNTSESISHALGVLKNELLAQDLKDIAIEAAAEHMIDDNFEYLLDESAVMPIRNKYLLVEMSFLQKSINLEEAIRKTASKGYFPILAHPERYQYLPKKINTFNDLHKESTYLQLNLLSLGEYYGDRVNKTAFELIDNNLIDFVASDVHHLNHIEELKKIKLSEKEIQKLLPIIENTIMQFY